MFRFFSLRNSFLTSSLISIGKMFTVVLVISLLLNPQIVNTIPAVWKTTIGLMTVTFAGLGLISCFYGFSRVAITAGFWLLSIYCLSNAFLSGQGSNSNSAGYFPKSLPGGLVYASIPDSSDNIFSAGLKVPSSKGIIDTLYAYVSKPAEQLGSAFDIKSTGMGSTGFSDLTFNSGVLPDSAFFPKNSGKRNFYPAPKSASMGGMGDIMNLLAVK